MRKITKDYAVYLAVGYAFMAVVVISMLFGYVSFYQYFGLMWTFIGFASLYWGLYYIKGREPFNITITSSFFVRKRNMEYYDKERMLRDLGKWQLIMGVFAIAFGVWIFIGDMFIEDILFVMGISLIFVAGVVVSSVAFMIVCRKSKYLKDPNVRPPKRGIFHSSK